MEILVDSLKDGEFTSEKHNITNLQILNDNPLNFSVRFAQKNDPPHIGFKTYKNVKSLALKQCVELLYEVIGQVYSDNELRYEHSVVKGKFDELLKELTKVDENLLQLKTQYRNAKQYFSDVKNLPNMKVILRDKLADSTRKLLEYKSYLQKITSQDDYIAKVKQFIPQLKTHNELVSLVNDRTEKILNAKASLDKCRTELKISIIKKNTLIEQLNILQEQLNRQIPELIYTTKKLSLEEDYEL